MRPRRGRRRPPPHGRSRGHEHQDAITFARWGVDYLKHDGCSTDDLNAHGAQESMSRALRNLRADRDLDTTGRPLSADVPGYDFLLLRLRPGR
jgi:hypothetical protein